MFSVSCQATDSTQPDSKRVSAAKLPGGDDVYQQYINFFEEVYDVVDKNYYKDIPREDFEAFIERFNTKIYPQLKESGKSSDFVRWRSAAFMIEHLKTDEDVFSAFYPPKPAKEYEQKALGKRVDFGITGEVVDQGYKVTHAEPRADPYEKGLRINDILTKVDGVDLKGLEESDIKELLKPFIETETAEIKLTYLDAQNNNAQKEIDVVSKSYFKQMVFMLPTKIPGIYALEIRRFNKKTAEDMLRYMEFFRKQGGIKGLILDLRGNPGGPPLAAREISSYFLPNGEDFAYFQKKGQPKSMLDVPMIPGQFHYDGPMVILVDKKSGSASELFSGILQRRKRAVLMGRNSAGQVMLKSMFHFDDESMVLLITSRGHHPDGSVFSFGGLIPDRYIEESDEDDIIDYATKYLVYVNQNLK